MSTWRWFLVVMVGWVGLLSRVVVGCDCLPSFTGDIAQGLNISTFSDVFLVVVRKQKVTQDNRFYVVKVRKVFRGCVQPRAIVALRTGLDQGACGVDLWSSVRYLVFVANVSTTFRRFPVFEIGLCSPLKEWTTVDATDRQRLLDEAQLQVCPPLLINSYWVQQEERFGLALFRAMSNGPNENDVTSTLNIGMALGLLSNGARENTAAQLFQSLGDQALVNPGYKTVRELWNMKWDGTIVGSPILRLVNKIYVEQTYSLRFGFQYPAVSYYGTSASPSDFRENPDGERLSINQWVEEVTENKIKDLLPRGSVTRDTRLVLVSALYFKGLWELPFDKAKTIDGVFNNAVGGPKTVRMMRNEKFYDRARDAHVSAEFLKLKYANSSLEMIVGLPDESSNLDEVENQLTADILASLSFSGSVVDVSLPQFTEEVSYDLVGPLMSLGMTDLFDSACDLSGISGNRDLVVSTVVHKAFIEVREGGTEAAAATAIVIGVTAIFDVPKFTVDRPFIYIIRDSMTGISIFTGHVARL
uniref:Serpin domain-containing protein n=1 Tax=Compsopogon caeruleus TaxID=31354 RepID=A0A7S1TGJ4_9RHOD|mmetsp:Transcript_4887/g.9873  ORF Transcript_4887/g.9873 Transcript_4887/m.9873 type:complete len:529 (+) Transcript_4887:69-1655(+)|eukprot:CAMPEP_0184685648 /NCGR_PEP_ID=MMETSP0312-20130426/19646_1 /TAXON_ID=31354 /ORGANISM="Compsopogon coeruleus, Strain SAG 36.94" /LENGTH=528 /DNA_ID=CAMNT_0027139927 /DNA_START=64 /DNA_END=1650 /DNA_ORIENTATION=-